MFSQKKLSHQEILQLVSDRADYYKLSLKR